MISKCLMTTLLLLVDVKLLECAGYTSADVLYLNSSAKRTHNTIELRGKRALHPILAQKASETCHYLPYGVHKRTLHYLLGDKIQLKVWCTTTDLLLGGPQARYMKFLTKRTNYDFYEHNNDANKGFTLDFLTVKMKKTTADGRALFNATATLIIYPALMLYDNERIIATITMAHAQYTTRMTGWVDIAIVQLKHESYNVIVPDTCPNVTLFCELESELEYPDLPERQPIYEWWKVEWDRRIPLPNSDTYVIGNDGTLVIHSLPKEEQTFYICELHLIGDTDEVTAQRTPSHINLTITEHTEDDLERPECNKPPPTTPPPTTEGITEPMNATTANPNYIEGIEYVDFAFVGVLILGTIAVTAAALYRINRVPTPRHHA